MLKEPVIRCMVEGCGNEYSSQLPGATLETSARVRGWAVLVYDGTRRYVCPGCRHQRHQQDPLSGDDYQLDLFDVKT